MRAAFGLIRLVVTAGIDLEGRALRWEVQIVFGAPPISQIVSPRLL